MLTFQGSVSVNGTAAFDTEGFNELSVITSLNVLNGVYVMNNTKATFLRDVELQNLTAQNVFTKTETDDTYALKAAVYTKTESDARYAQVGAGGDDNESA